MSPASGFLVTDGSEHAAPICVLQLVPRLESGGVERGAIEIARAVTAAGGRALVASAGGRLEIGLRRAGAELIRLPMDSKSPFRIRANARILADIVRKEGVDIIHARSRAPAWSGLRAARMTGIPFVTTYHGVYSTGFPGKKWYNSVMARGEPTIAVSEFVRAHIQAEYGLTDDQVIAIPRGADVESFSEDSVSTERTISLAEKWGVIEDPRPIVMLPGRLTGWKGQNLFIEAAKILRERSAAADTELDCQFMLVGDDGGSGYGARLEKQAVEAGLAGQFRMVGHCADMEAAYKLAAVVVSASLEPEAFGRVMVEAQAMGRPVIASDHGGSSETVDHGKTGWLIPPGDASALADAIEAALSLDESARAHMGMAGRARIRGLYTTKAMQDATLAVYEQVAGRVFPAHVTTSL